MLKTLWIQFYACRLFAGLWILILGGFMNLFVGGEVADLGLAILGAVIFSG
jgi:FtsH-binding integral membrane protein